PAPPNHPIRPPSTTRSKRTRSSAGKPTNGAIQTPLAALPELSLPTTQRFLQAAAAPAPPHPLHQLDLLCHAVERDLSCRDNRSDEAVSGAISRIVRAGYTCFSRGGHAGA